ncbi:MAG: Fe-S cluster assembly protein SufD [Chitinophagales bacterium]|nr:Fe-S cluster assembly protein SufD [Chitinophagales bacterium]
MSATMINEDFRTRAKAFLQTNGMPTSRDEEWRFTNLRKYFTDAVAPNSTSVELPAYYHNCEGNKIVLVNGVLDAERSQFDNTIEVTNTHPLLGSGIQEENYFTALNAANYTDALCISVKGENQPIHIFHIITKAEFVFPRILLSAKRSSSVVVNEFYTTSSTANVSAVIEVFLEENANVNWHAIQHDNGALNVVNHVEAQVARDARFQYVSLSQNSRFIRNTIQARLNGENAYASLNGFYQTDGESLVDNHVLIDHKVANCESHQLFKGLLDGEGTGVFNGKIMVHQDAQKTNAYQSSKAVLLSETATIHTKPQLEIFADDVKCSHGAAIGQMNKNEIFYFMARGIDEKKAAAILNYAYVVELYERVSDEKLKAYLIEKLKKESDIDF